MHSGMHSITGRKLIARMVLPRLPDAALPACSADGPKTWRFSNSHLYLLLYVVVVDVDVDELVVDVVLSEVVVVVVDRV